MKNLEIPILRANELFHWGTMDISNIAPKNNSFEGNNLSLSHCPDEWLGLLKPDPNRKLFEFTKKGSGKFVNIIDVLYSGTHQELKMNFLAIALKKQLIISEKVIQYEYCDDNDETVKRFFKNEKELIAEIGDEDFWKDSIEEVTVYSATPLLIEKLGLEPTLGFCNGLEYAIIEILRTQENDIDGILWDHTFDPNNYSLPLFCIFPEKIKEWKVREIEV